MNYDAGFLLDGLILVFLSVTIFYAARLSLFLKSFREGKDGMQILIRDLSSTVDKAEGAIKGMKAHALETESELRDIINEAKFLSDELRFMNETGDSLANRLEKLADRNRELVDLIENSGGIGSPKMPKPMSKEADAWDVNKTSKKTMRPVVEDRAEDDGFQISDFEINDLDIDADDEHDFMALDDGAYKEELVHQSKVKIDAKSKIRSFAIFDRDHLDGQENNIKDDLALSDDKQAHKDEKEFHSQAEQDLYEALQRRRKRSRVSEVS